MPPTRLPSAVRRRNGLIMLSYAALSVIAIVTIYFAASEPRAPSASIASPAASR